MNTWAWADSNGIDCSLAWPSAATSCTGWQRRTTLGLLAGRRASNWPTRAWAWARVTAPTMLTLARHGHQHARMQGLHVGHAMRASVCSVTSRP
jgi:hypothetical protein